MKIVFCYVQLIMKFKIRVVIACICSTVRTVIVMNLLSWPIDLDFEATRPGKISTAAANVHSILATRNNPSLSGSIPD